MITSTTIRRALYHAAQNPNVPKHQKIEYLRAATALKKSGIRVEAIPEVAEALRIAQRHTVAHHACNTIENLKAGGLCPVCCKEDGTEPELDKIAAALAKMEGGQG